ncbi:MAG TPA: hypothetical protein VL992_05915, partial [Tepidisphaeraceae bacterium]|nr:hypothetical protein [Tepidisphaeraceae bacterium]
MRSLAVILTTFAGLCAAFFLYTKIAAPPGHPVDAAADLSPAATAAAINPVGGALGQGQAAWVNLYDKNTGQLYARLRAAQYVPLPQAHAYHLVHPEADLYQRDGQIVHLNADDGDVQMGDQDQQHTLTGGGPMNPPEHGILHDVLVRLYQGRAAQERDDPDLTIHLDNAEFDADTCRVYTVDEIDPATGLTIPADQAPVTVRGRDVDFDGEGLLLDWNDAAHDLKSLIIEHGRRMRIKNAGALDSKPAETTEPPAAPVRASAAPASSSAPTVATASAPPSAPATRAEATRLYVATLTNDVRVMQDGQEKVHADEMDVTLARKAENPGPKPAVAQSSSPASATPAAQKASSSQSPPPPLPAPAAQPSAPVAQTGDVDVFWNGPLVVVPQSNPEGTLKPGQEIIHFSGSPVHVWQDNLEMIGGSARYLTANGSARMTGIGDRPVKLTFFNNDHRPAGTVLSQRVDFQNAPHSTQRVAIFGGAGVADFADPARPDDALRAAWQRRCDVYLSPGRQSEIQRAVLWGDADVRDRAADGREKMRLTGQQIVADFARPDGAAKNASPVVKRVTSTGDALCVIHDLKGHQSDQSISTDLLTVETDQTDEGDLYPDLVTADGNVHAVQGEDQLWTKKLIATIAPTDTDDEDGSTSDQSRYHLQTLLATGGVQARGKDGQSASGDVLSMDNRGDEPLVMLLGGAQPAMISGDNGTLRGPRIDARPDSHWGLVSGPGDIDAVQMAAPGKPPRPLHVQWQNSAEVDGDRNIVDLRGLVQAHSKDPGGTIDDARADRAILYLVQGATEKPKKPARKTKTQTGAPPFDLMSGKQVRQISLLNHAEIASATFSPAGKLLRRTTIAGDRIDAHLPEQRLVVPGPGRMLLEDYTPSPRRQAATADPSAGAGRGETSFQWVKQFSFDEFAHRAVFDGPVTIVHWPDLSGKKGTTMLADRVTADFLPVTPAKGKIAPSDA